MNIACNNWNPKRSKYIEEVDIPLNQKQSKGFSKQQSLDLANRSLFRVLPRLVGD